MKSYLLIIIAMLSPTFPKAQTQRPTPPPVAVEFAESLEQEMRETLMGVAQELKHSTDEFIAIMRNDSDPELGFGMTWPFISETLLPDLTNDEIVEYAGITSEHWSACWKHILNVDPQIVTSKQDAVQILPSSCQYIMHTMAYKDDWPIINTKEEFDAYLEELKTLGRSETTGLLDSDPPYWQNPIYKYRHERPKMNSIETRLRLRRERRFDEIPALENYDIYYYAGIPHLGLYIGVVWRNSKTYLHEILHI